MVDKAGAPFVKANIPANTYTGQTAACARRGGDEYLVTHEGMKEETVYEMTKAIYENLGDLGAAHAAARSRSSSRVRSEGMPIPLHRGAARYFKEKGLKVGS